MALRHSRCDVRDRIRRCRAIGSRTKAVSPAAWSVDSSTFAVFYLDVFPPTSATVIGTMNAIREKLWVQTEVGGVWLAEHAVRRAQTVVELQSALDLVRWARSKAPASLVLPEQVVSVVRAYLEARQKIRAASRESSMRSKEEIDRKNVVDNH